MKIQCKIQDLPQLCMDGIETLYNGSFYVPYNKEHIQRLVDYFMENIVEVK